MTKAQVLKKIKEKGLIAAVKDEEGLKKAINSDIGVIFILYGDIMNIEDIVKTIRDAGKAAIVHLDLITGLGTKEISVDYIKEKTHADGIISTKQSQIKRAKELKMFTVMRFFVIDSLALVNLHHQCSAIQPDCIEILPGLMPKIIKKISEEASCPLIAGGLISDQEDINAALSSGALAVSTSHF